MKQGQLLQSQEKSEFYANKFEEANMVIQGITIAVGKIVDLFKSVNSPFAEESDSSSHIQEDGDGVQIKSLIGSHQNIIVGEDNIKQVLGLIQSETNDVITLNQIFSYAKRQGGINAPSSGEEQVDVASPAKITMPLPGSIVKLIATNPMPAIGKINIMAPSTKYAHPVLYYTLTLQYR